MDKYYLSLEVLTVVCIYSLLWFVLGIRVGQRLPGLGSTVVGGKKGKQGGKKGKKARNGRNGRDSSQPRRRSGNIEIYIGNLSYDLGEKEIRKEFKAFGKVTSVRLIKNNFNGKSKGYGFIEMIDRNDAEMAIRQMNNKDLLGRRIIVNEAKTNARG